MKRIDELQVQFCGDVCKALNDVLLANITEHEFVEKVTSLRYHLLHDCNERITGLIEYVSVNTHIRCEEHPCLVDINEVARLIKEYYDAEVTLK